MEEKDFIRHFGQGSIVRGKRLYRDEFVDELDVREEIDTGIITIDATVFSSDLYDIYNVRILLGRNGNYITGECTCPYYEQNLMGCKHMVATLYEYMDEEELSIIGNGYIKEPIEIKSDHLITDLLNSYSSTSPTVQRPVHLYPYFSIDEDNSLTVSFKVGYLNDQQYQIQSLNSFCALINNDEFHRYGKKLEFTHNRDVFDSTSKPLIDFLMSLYNKDDTYTESTQRNNYYYYYSYTTDSLQLKKTLSLKGRYLDEFIECLEKSNSYEVKDIIPKIETSLIKKENGYSFQGTNLKFAKGNQHIYFIDPLYNVIEKASINEETIRFYEFLKNARGKEMFIADNDLPKFSKYIYPVVSTKTLLKNDGFDPYDYEIPQPEFELYLDAPQKDLITGMIKAIYPDNEYNILDPDKSGKRDLDEEKKIDSTISSYFNSYSDTDHALAYHGDDEDIYYFITESIPRLQETITVFVSDKLKKMSVRAMPKVSLGVSVNHDLLQLDFNSNQMSLSEVAEILSKYDRKKKYYRLKDGTYLDMSHSDMNELISIKDNLSLSKKDIESGNIELPKFRAMYLDSLESNDTFDLDYSSSFRKMIQKMEEINQEKYEVPKDVNAELRSYQVDGMRWLCALRDNGFGGLLADEMGLGKTLQVIAMLGTYKERKRTLVVCPASLVYNWNIEFNRFCPNIPHRMIQGTQEERKQLILSSKENEVLITSYDLLKRDIEYYEDIHFSCEVIDEAQYIKNATTQNSRSVKSIQADFKIALTGTPIENKLSELWSIFDYLMPGFFHGYETFKKQYEIPITRDEDEFMQEELNTMITPFVLRRLKKDVLKDLPDKLEEIYYAPLEGEQKKLYEAEVQKIKLLVGKQTDQEFKENKIQILAELTRLRQLCCYPGLVYDHYKDNSSKTDMCVDLILQAIEGGHKILLFSQFTSMLDELRKRLDKERIRYYLLEGKTPKKVRASMVEAFQNDDTPLFLISLKAGGTGLNLTAADIVIHYDPWWNTAVENQASDRAHRIGQTNIVTVYKLIVQDSIEERIIDLQQQKSDLANRILSGDGISSSKLSREDLLYLL